MSWLVRLRVPVSQVEAVSSDLWGLGTTGIAEMVRDGDHAELVAGFNSQRQSTAAAELLADHGAIAEEVPPWPTPEPDTITTHGITMTIDAGHAFGHGRHPTTELAADLLLSLMPAEHVLDLGCGSGVLSIAAAKAGAESVVAIDNDRAAVRATDKNATANDVDIAVSLTPLHDLVGLFEVIVANMLPVELEPLAGEVASRVMPGGNVVVSGFLSGHHQRVADFFPTMRLLRVREHGDWGALVLGAPAVLGDEILGDGG